MIILSYTIPIIVEQSIMPVTPKYSLGSKLTVTASQSSPQSSPSHQTSSFDGYFRRNEQPVAYGLLSWSNLDTTSNSRSDYNLTLTKVYVCSSTPGSDYTPLYDPDGTLYSRGSQFGCERDHPSLRYRILLLDRHPSENISQQQQPTINSTSLFGAEFVDTKHLHGSISDGFKFNTSALFDLSGSATSGLVDSTWYVHVFFVIRPSNANGQVNNNNNNKNVFNNGTNMQIIRLTTSSPRSPLTSAGGAAASGAGLGHYRQNVRGGKFKNGRGPKESARKGDEESRDYYYFMQVIMPIIVCLTALVLALSTLIYCKREQIHQFLFVGSGKCL